MQAYSRYFSKLGGRPTIQTRHGKQAVWLTSELFAFTPLCCDVKTREVPLYSLRLGTRKHPLGMLQFKAHKAFQPPNSISISVHAGRWHLSFSFDSDIPEPDEKDTIAWLRQHDAQELVQMTFGADRGVAIPLATGDGQEFGFSAVQKDRIARQEKHRKRWQRRMARRVKGSNNHRKAKLRVARYHRYAADARRDMAHKTSRSLVNMPNIRLVVFEALKLKNMTASARGTVAAPGKRVAQKAGLYRSLLGSALGQIKTYTQYKARRAGKLCLAVPPHHSSQECAACGFTHPDNRPGQAEFICQRCGNRDNADFNAGKVIAKRGIHLVLSDDVAVQEKKRCAIKRNKVGAGSSEPAAMPLTLVEICVRRPGLSVPAQQSVKQETPTTSRRL